MLLSLAVVGAMHAWSTTGAAQEFANVGGSNVGSTGVVSPVDPTGRSLRSGAPSSPTAPLAASRPDTWPGGALPQTNPAAATYHTGGQAHPFESAQIIAKVGSEVVLASDVMYLVGDYMEGLENIERAPREEIERAKIALARNMLKSVIEIKLWLTAARREFPPDKMSEIETDVNKSFERDQIPPKLRKFKVATRYELDEKLRGYGSSLQAMRRGYFERSIAMIWRRKQAKDDAEITHEEMLNYYHEHEKTYEITARAKWEHLMIKHDHYDSKEAARKAMADLGNQVQRGAPLSAMATKHSDDPSSIDGGKHDWTAKDSLVSTVLDQAIFGLPIGQLSQILEDEQGYHIVRVTERRDQSRKSFLEVQKEIKGKIRDLRGDKKAEAFLEEVRKQVPVWTIYDKPTVDAASRPAADAALR